MEIKQAHDRDWTKYEYEDAAEYEKDMDEYYKLKRRLFHPAQEYHKHWLERQEFHNKFMESLDKQSTQKVNDEN